MIQGVGWVCAAATGEVFKATEETCVEVEAIQLGLIAVPLVGGSAAEVRFCTTGVVDKSITVIIHTVADVGLRSKARDADLDADLAVGGLEILVATAAGPTVLGATSGDHDFRVIVGDAGPGGPVCLWARNAGRERHDTSLGCHLPELVAVEQR